MEKTITLCSLCTYRKLMANVQLGIPLSLVTHTFLTPVDASEHDEAASALLGKRLNSLSGRVFTPVPDVVWLRNTQFHATSEAASSTTSRIPILIGYSKEVLKQIGCECDVTGWSDDGFCVKTVGASLVLMGKRGTRGVENACCWLIQEVLDKQQGGETIEIGELDEIVADPSEEQKKIYEEIKARYK